jgi:hypothetical protein
MIACITPTVPHTDPTAAATPVEPSPSTANETPALHLLGKVTRKAVVTPLIETTAAAIGSAQKKYPLAATSRLHAGEGGAGNVEEEIIEEEVEEFGYAEDEL